MTAPALTRTHMTMTEARSLTRFLLDEQGLTEWTVVFNNRKKTAGLCNYSTKEIALSKYLLAQRTSEDSKDTITHEIAHALTRGHRHDAVWAAKHRELGGNGKRCFEHLDENAPWIATCEHGVKTARYRAPKRLTGWSCMCLAGKSTVTWEKRK